MTREYLTGKKALLEAMLATAQAQEEAYQTASHEAYKAWQEGTINAAADLGVVLRRIDYSGYEDAAVYCDLGGDGAGVGFADVSITIDANGVITKASVNAESGSYAKVADYARRTSTMLEALGKYNVKAMFVTAITEVKRLREVTNDTAPKVSAGNIRAEISAIEQDIFKLDFRVGAVIREINPRSETVSEKVVVAVYRSKYEYYCLNNDGTLRQQFPHRDQIPTVANIVRHVDVAALEAEYIAARDAKPDTDI